MPTSSPSASSAARHARDPRGAIWHRYSSADWAERATLAQELVNRAAVEAYDARRPNPAWRPVPVRPLAGLEGAVLLMRAKDEEDILPQNLRHHHRMGFRRFFILDNGSTDGTAQAIEAFRAEASDSLVFSAVDPIVANRPAEKLNALAAFAEIYLSGEERPADWMFFLDADEFLTPYGLDDGEIAARRLEGVLTDPRALLLTFHWVQCSSAAVLEVLPQGADPFEALSVSWPVMKVPVPKVAFRAKHGLQVIAGNHNVVEFPFPLERSASAAQAGWFMHHYATRSVEQVRRKVVKVRRALDALGGPAGAQVSGHWRALIAGYEIAGDRAIRESIAWHIQDCATGR